MDKPIPAIHGAMCSMIPVKDSAAVERIKQLMQPDSVIKQYNKGLEILDKSLDILKRQFERA